MGTGSVLKLLCCKGISMNQWENFLSECVYYPCSGLHGTPVKLLSSRFQKFFFCDYFIKLQEFLNGVENGGFNGYTLTSLVDVSPEDIFGVSWDRFRSDNDETFSRLHFDWCEPFIAFCTFRREADVPGSHGPEKFELLFARSEAIATFDSVFSRHRISPKCLVHVRSGMGFGGNFSGYPRLLEDSLRTCRGGLPQFILHDSLGVGPGGDRLQLINEYREVQTWGYPDGGYLRLVERGDVD